MESLFILIPIAMLIVFIAVRLFIWAVRSGQFEDLDTEGKRILFDNDIKTTSTSKANSDNKDTTAHTRSDKLE
ncbi:cbb3-type cytochrome oxidase assembly protein CcoS [Agarilytica rhodophyticola]|uniref:cbb3-type cytochrome oxidase assembly protein CcoS n=1 Tax=Agarilytica rhodophyticola TaxID=1737490 RepID=UPI000B34865D|nr:cbb3-type cytochrome oxidase assembly protein CcoS [Agarilytica rhodophyticola]